MPIGLPKVPFFDYEDDYDYNYDYGYADYNHDDYAEKKAERKAERKQAWTDLYSKLYHGGILFLGDVIDTELANELIAAMVYLDSHHPEIRCYMYINSPGGGVFDGLAIYDAMKNIMTQEVRTTVYGQAASMASLLLASGEKGHRIALPHSEIMLHEPSMSPTRGKVEFLLSECDVLASLKERMLNIYVLETGKDRLVFRGSPTKRSLFGTRNSPRMWNY
uniref:ATP-dependent Clp protease proteolytic subunit n=1 Tax=Jasminum nudiflorum TaxID=126431 RepID=Q06RA7_JASNU|nr:ATP-dependent Clp protease proteolytic subunit [Jasminum nudiflorum]ABG74651.1 ATP-dependent protease catalytic subunit [Jasminum nudiflorum]